MSTRPSKAAPIRVTDHALERARERHADLRLLGERELLRTICREVGAALRHDRVAKTAPRETLDATFDRRQKVRDEGWARFAWNAGRSRVYFLRRQQHQFVVVTVLATVHSQS